VSDELVQDRRVELSGLRSMASQVAREKAQEAASVRDRGGDQVS